MESHTTGTGADQSRPIIGKGRGDGYGGKLQQRSSRRKNTSCLEEDYGDARTPAPEQSIQHHHHSYVVCTWYEHRCHLGKGTSATVGAVTDLRIIVEMRARDFLVPALWLAQARAQDRQRTGKIRNRPWGAPSTPPGLCSRAWRAAWQAWQPWAARVHRWHPQGGLVGSSRFKTDPSIRRIQAS